MAPPRQRRPSLVVLGLLFVALAALGGALVFGGLTDTTSVVVVGVDLEPGQVVEPGDLRVVELSNLGDAVTLSATEQGRVVGRVARGPVPAGTVVHPDLFGPPGSAIPTGMAVVGAALEPGAAPGPDLRAGDRIDVLGVAGGGSGLEARAEVEALVLATGSVWSVERPGGVAGGRLVVSMLVPAETRTVVAQAAADDRLRLALVAGE